MQNQSPVLLCLGFGYVASYLTPLAIAGGWQVVGTTRRLQTGTGAQLIAPEDAASWCKRAQAILISTPPGQGQDWAYDLCQTHAGSQLTWLGYLSSTGVYGDHNGAWVDECSALQPQDARTQARRDAELQWQLMQAPVHLFRLAGIYGPQRNALRQLQEGRARRIHKPGHVFSRTHVDDIVRILYASMNAPSEGGAYNIADDHPAGAHEVVAFAAELLGIYPPPLESFANETLSPMMQSFYNANRRVSNDKIKRELGIELAYPSYKEGLAALIQDVRNEL